MQENRFYLLLAYLLFYLLCVFIDACRFPLVTVSGGNSLVVVRGLLISVASLVAEHKL